jgi:hypothetical protein
VVWTIYNYLKNIKTKTVCTSLPRIDPRSKSASEYGPGSTYPLANMGLWRSLFASGFGFPSRIWTPRVFYHCIVFYYILVESEILKNTQWDIFHIFTSEDIDHVTFSRYWSRGFWEWNFTIFYLGLYNKQNITRWLEDMTFIFSC